MKKVLFILVLFTVTACNIGTFFQHIYYKSAYHPEYIQTSKFTTPETYTLTGIPCISYKNAYCASASLQMIDPKPGTDIHYYNWAMGFTYGCFFSPDGSFIPYNDPETGYVQATPFLGLVRHYQVTSDSAQYIGFLKTSLEKGLPCRVALNSAALYGKKGFYPHSVLVIGYTKNDVLYYETGGADRNLQAYSGDKVSWKMFLEAVESMSKGFNYEWKYNLSTFEKSNTVVSDAKLPELNGQLLIGTKNGPIQTGSGALTAMADFLLKNPSSLTNKAWIAGNSWAFEAGVYTRRDDADFLRNRYAGNAPAMEAADCLDKSALNFKTIREQLAKSAPDAGEIAQLLKNCGALEKHAGEKLKQVR